MSVFPLITLLQPPRIHFGAGCAMEAAAPLARAGHRRAFVITSPSVRTHAAALACVPTTAGTGSEVSHRRPAHPRSRLLR